MPPEAALLESRALRDSVRNRTDSLDRVKALILLPDDIHVTTSMVADYFEVGVEAVKSLVKDHRRELTANGYRILAGQELRSFKDLSGIHPRTPSLALFSRRTVLNVAMLLQDSPVAREVRVHLLDTEAERREPAPPRWAVPPVQQLGPGPHWDEYEYLQAHPQAATPEHYQRSDQRIHPDQGTGHSRVISAMSGRLHRVGEDVREVREEVSDLHADIAELQRKVARFTNPRRRR
jgi:hypothetical protein